MQITQFYQVLESILMRRLYAHNPFLSKTLVSVNFKVMPIFSVDQIWSKFYTHIPPTDC